MRNAATPVTLIIIGVLGLVWYFRWLPDFDSITAVALVAGGIAILVMDGITKHSVVLGPTLIAVSRSKQRFCTLAPLDPGIRRFCSSTHDSCGVSAGSNALHN